MKLYLMAMMATPRSTLVLAIGILWMLFSVSTGFEVPGSGAVLICACVIAEVLHLREPWKRHEKMPGEYAVEKVRRSDGKIQMDFTEVGIWKRYHNKQFSKIPEPIPSMHLIGNPKDRRRAVRSLLRLEAFALFWGDSNYVDRPAWYYNGAAEKADNRFTITVAGLLILGTLLWGYGHRFFSSC